MSRGGRSFALLLLAFGAAAAADLNPQTEQAWNGYVASVRARMDARLGPTACFLWAEEDAGRLQRLRAGDILVAPADPTPWRVPGGLIHHWLGAVFIPGVTLDEVLSTLRNYSRYPQYYPSVVSSKLLARDGPTDWFTSMERHQAMFSRIALDASFTSTYTDAGAKRAYSTSSTTRLQQIQNYGGREQHELAPDAAKAYMWRLSTISRYLERDGGVYVELEGMVLSRDIPASLRWLVAHFVREAAANTMAGSLRQTRDAVLADHGSATVSLRKP